MSILLYNTATKQKEIFTPLEENKVRLYVCGITPHTHAHVGHLRSGFVYDFLKRFLTFSGYEVTYVRNITDIDDKIVERMNAQSPTIKKCVSFTKPFLEEYEHCLSLIGCSKPDAQPRVTSHIKEIISFIEKLLAKNIAYATIHGDVYFSVACATHYGYLSKQQSEELLAGNRGCSAPGKKSPEDFALWKRVELGVKFSSPWGGGRPGWHIECSALLLHYLGEQTDIHGGGLDLIFPHHENEAAQSESLFSHPLSRIWMHHGLVTIGKEKMSKSLGNVLYAKDAVQLYPPSLLRFLFLQHHYRQPMEIDLSEQEGLRKAAIKIEAFFTQLPSFHFSDQDLTGALSHPIISQMLDCLRDDLNSPKMLALLFEHRDQLLSTKEQISFVQMFLKRICGLDFHTHPLPVKKRPERDDPYLKALLEEREVARKNRDWKTADRIREELLARGIELSDQKI